ncbi:MAG: BamA/TamA family outer membrane protein [Proteobacteria bacterium]|nr:BamA/TamA family outer membrane protein [Pseudomonadota bacterium]
MTLTFKILLPFFLLVFCRSTLANESLPAIAEILDRTDSPCRLERVDFSGLIQTDRDWFHSYLEISRLPTWVGSVEAVSLRQKIMTTDVFSEAEVDLRKSENEGCILNISVKEKWTTIPVLRAAYGGGTPLLVLGGYETNGAGRLYSLGFEARRYGTRPPGFLLFAKSPRAWRGRGSFGGELWLDRRRRGFFDQNGKVAAYADSEALTAKIQGLFPLQENVELTRSWQIEIHGEMIEESPTVFNDLNLNNAPGLKPSDVSTHQYKDQTVVIMPMLVFDNINVDKLNMDGLRLITRYGGQLSSEVKSPASDIEAFYYTRGLADFSLALHAMVGSQGDNSIRNLYFLGGFDSVRGLPDGISYGTKIGFGSSELRYLATKMKYLQIQLAVFGDHGAAFSQWDRYAERRESSLGFGIRFFVPQVFRMLVRIDYAKSMGKTKSQGFSVGIGQFFQPYKLTF